MASNKGGGGSVERLRLYYLIEQTKHAADVIARGACQLSHAEATATAHAASQLHDLQWLMAKYLKIDRSRHWYK